MVVGFDFGTHQTKVCIEDRSDPQRPVYKFWKFKTPDGESYTLPSVVQINNDDTLTYGHVNKSCVGEIGVDAGAEPLMPNLREPVMVFSEPKPKLKLPEKPKPQKQDWKDVLKAWAGGKNSQEQEWEKACKEAQLDYDQDLRIWKIKYEKAQKKFEQEYALYEQAMRKYEEEHREWEYKATHKVPAIFRYFKQATFSNTIRWNYSIDKDLLSIWYIANILFDLETEYGQTFSVQLGFPTDAKRLFTRRNHAYRLILSAYYLVEDVFHGDKDAFLLSTYQELTELTEIIPPSEEKAKEYGILALPEAYANLVTVTAKKQIEKGISFVVDIGGGTTDISLFNIDEDDAPHIYGYTSIDKGINYIVETSAKHLDIWRQNSLNDIPECDRAMAVDSLIKEVRNSCKMIIHDILKAFDKVDLSKIAIYEALENRIVVYSGGGSTYDFLCQEIHQFTDIRRMDKRIWNGFYLEKADEVLSLAPILSTALGLSVQREEGDNIKISDLHEIFAHLPKKGDAPELIWGRRPEDMYGLADD